MYLMAENETYTLLEIMKSRYVHKKTKFQIHKTVIRIILCYGCETWVMKEKIETALGIFERIHKRTKFWIYK